MDFIYGIVTCFVLLVLWTLNRYQDKLEARIKKLEEKEDSNVNN